MSGKGSARRPSAIATEAVDANYVRTFPVERGSLLDGVMRTSVARDDLRVLPSRGTDDAEENRAWLAEWRRVGAPPGSMRYAMATGVTEINAMHPPSGTDDAEE